MSSSAWLFSSRRCLSRASHSRRPRPLRPPSSRRPPVPAWSNRSPWVGERSSIPMARSAATHGRSAPVRRLRDDRGGGYPAVAAGRSGPDAESHQRPSRRHLLLRVRRRKLGGAVGSIESPWSTVRSFMVAGIGAAPGTPSFTSPATGNQVPRVRILRPRMEPAVPTRSITCSRAMRRATLFGPADADHGIPSSRHEVPRRMEANRFPTSITASAPCRPTACGLPSATLNVNMTKDAARSHRRRRCCRRSAERRFRSR